MTPFTLLRISVTLFYGLLLMPLSLAAPPSNDHWRDALTITALPETHQQSTQQATDEEDEALPSCAHASASVWYQYTPSVNQTLIVDTLGSDYDTVLSVWSQVGWAMPTTSQVDKMGYEMSGYALANPTYKLVGKSPHIFQLHSLVVDNAHPTWLFRKAGQVYETPFIIHHSKTVLARLIHDIVYGILTLTAITFNDFVSQKNEKKPSSPFNSTSRLGFVPQPSLQLLLQLQPKAMKLRTGTGQCH